MFRQLTKTVILKSDEDLDVNPLAPTVVLVVGNQEALDLNDLITRNTGSLARVDEKTWQSLKEGMKTAIVDWLCESCMDDLEENAGTRRHKENLCQDCADEIDRKKYHQNMEGSS